MHLPFDPLADILYQPGHHGVWKVFRQPTQALVTHAFTQYVYTSVTTVVPPTAIHLAFASPGPGQTLHIQGSCLKPLPILPAHSLSDHIRQWWKT